MGLDGATRAPMGAGTVEQFRNAWEALLPLVTTLLSECNVDALEDGSCLNPGTAILNSLIHVLTELVIRKQLKPPCDEMRINSESDQEGNSLPHCNYKPDENSFSYDTAVTREDTNNYSNVGTEDSKAKNDENGDSIEDVYLQIQDETTETTIIPMNKSHQCTVTHVESSWNFFISLKSLNDIHSDDLQCMQEFYEENVKCLARPEVQINELYVFEHEAKWVRVQVKSLDEDNARIFFIDLGNEMSVKIKKLYTLVKMFKKIVPLAFKCHLFNICPTKIATGWCEDSKKYMMDKCLHKNGTILAMEQIDDSLGVLLTLDNKPVHFQVVKKTYGIFGHTMKALRVARDAQINSKVADSNIPQENFLEKGVPLNCMISHCVDPSNFYVRLINGDSEKMLEELNKYYSANKNTSKKCSKTLYAAFHENLWHRAVLNDNLNEKEGIVDAYLIDKGVTLKLPRKALKPLCAKFCDQPAMAFKCYLYKVIPTKGNWCSKAIRQTTVAILGKKGVITVHEGDSASYGVSLLIDNISVNEKLILKGYGETSKTLEPIPEDVIPEIMNQPMGTDEEEMNITKALQGHTANDQAEVCPHYKGPPATTCFKGSRCKLLHQLLNRDGWTIKKLPVVIEASQVLPDPEAFIELKITHPLNYRSFYGHIINSSNSSHDENGFSCEQLENLQKILNSPALNKTFKTYNKEEVLPAIAELVIAQYKEDNQWYRAKVLEVDEYECLVFYIDYGNKDTVSLDKVAVLDKMYAELPPQGMYFVIDNIDLLNNSQKEVIACRELYTYICKKQLFGHITAVDLDAICILLIDDLGDVGEYLYEKGLIKLRPPTNINWKDRLVLASEWLDPREENGKYVIVTPE